MATTAICTAAFIGGLSLQAAFLQFMYGQYHSPSLSDFKPVIDTQCVPTVRAIEKFYKENGRLPESIHELRAKYLPVLFGYRQDIEDGEFDQWSYWGHLIYYDLKKNDGVWHINGPNVDGIIQTDPPSEQQAGDTAK